MCHLFCAPVCGWSAVASGDFSKHLPVKIFVSLSADEAFTSRTFCINTVTPYYPTHKMAHPPMVSNTNTGQYRTVAHFHEDFFLFILKRNSWSIYLHSKVFRIVYCEHSIQWYAARLCTATLKCLHKLQFNNYTTVKTICMYIYVCKLHIHMFLVHRHAMVVTAYIVPI